MYLYTSQASAHSQIMSFDVLLFHPRLPKPTSTSRASSIFSHGLNLLNMPQIMLYQRASLTQTATLGVFMTRA
jgi:hypothetical protein